MASGVEVEKMDVIELRDMINIEYNIEHNIEHASVEESMVPDIDGSGY